MSTSQSIESLLGFFKHEHLPERLQEISKPFGDFALRVAAQAPESLEKAAALRKLLEAKDCAVRAGLG